MPACSSFVLLLLVGTMLASSRGNYIVYTQRYTADPAPLVFNNRVYMYTSHDGASQRGWDMTDYVAMSSDDMVNWLDHGIVFSVNSTSWAHLAWAQQVVAVNGSFIMYYPDGGEHGGGVGVAISTSPTGPFVDVLGGPLVPGDDPTVFIDDDDSAYLCSNTGGPFCAPLAHNMTALAAPQRYLNGTPNWFEAPWLTKIRGTYVLSYMTNTTLGHYGYDIAYSTSGSVLGNYTYRGSVLWSPPFDCGAGNATLCVDGGGSNSHQGMFEYPPGSGAWYLAYHNRKLAVDNGQYVGFQRNIALDRMYIAADGSLMPVTSTPSWLRQLHYVNPYMWTPAVLAAEMSFGLLTEACSEGGLNVGNITQGAYVRVAGLDFGAAPGATTFIARVASPVAGGAITVKLNGVAGVAVATCIVPNTTEWQVYANTSCMVTGASGVHDVYFVYTGSGPSALFNMLAWGFEGGTPSGAVPPPFKTTVALRSKARNAYLTIANSVGGGVLTASAAAVSQSETFTLLDNENGTYSLLSAGSSKYVCADGTGVAALAANAEDADAPCTQLRLQGTTDGSYALAAQTGSALFLAVTPGAPFTLYANCSDPRAAAADAARFWVEDVPASM